MSPWWGMGMSAAGRPWSIRFAPSSLNRAGGQVDVRRVPVSIFIVRASDIIDTKTGTSHLCISTAGAKRCESLPACDLVVTVSSDLLTASYDANARPRDRSKAQLQDVRRKTAVWACAQ